MKTDHLGQWNEEAAREAPEFSACNCGADAAGKAFPESHLADSCPRSPWWQLTKVTVEGLPLLLGGGGRGGDAPRAEFQLPEESQKSRQVAPRGIRFREPFFFPLFFSKRNLILSGCKNIYHRL
jgi:hypothetical protein